MNGMQWIASGAAVTGREKPEVEFSKEHLDIEKGLAVETEHEGVEDEVSGFPPPAEMVCEGSFT